MTRTRCFLLTLVLLAGCALSGCGGSAAVSTVTVLGSWTGNEQKGFLAMVRGFEQQNHIRVDYIGTRDANAVLTSDLKDGNPPDLAVLATPGELDQYAKAGALLPLDTALNRTDLDSEYGPGWRSLMQAEGPHGRHYFAIIVKAALKSVIWYDPLSMPPGDQAVLTSPHLTWAELTGMAAHGATPWCVGLEDSSSSGWPGTDWIEDILLHQSGPRAYDQWVAGQLRWTSPPVMNAWQAFGEIADEVHGGAKAELLTSYAQAGQPMFVNPPGCYLDHEGSFITGFYTNYKAHPQPETDFRFVPFPALTAAGQHTEEVAGDLLGMFHDTAAARKLIAYLTTPQAQRAWISRPGSGAISVNKGVPLSAYPDLVSHDLAEDLVNATDVRFDASDSMPQTMQNAFLGAVLEYVDAPSQLTVILRGLDQVQKSAS